MDPPSMKKIRDIAALRKEERGRQDSSINSYLPKGKARQQSANFMARTTSRAASRISRTYYPGKDMNFQLRDKKRDSKDKFAVEFAQMGNIGEDNKNIKGARRRPRYDDVAKVRISENKPTASIKPRWNVGTRKHTSNHQLHTGNHEPIIKSIVKKPQKHRPTSLKNTRDEVVNERQNKSKTTAKDTDENSQPTAIPTVKSSTQAQQADNYAKAPGLIKRHLSDPIPSTKPSTKVHRERCCVLKARPDTPFNANQNVYWTRRARKRMELIKHLPDKHIEEVEESRTIFEEAINQKLELIAKKLDVEPTTSHINRQQYVSRIPVPSTPYAVMNSSALGTRRYFLDAQGQTQLLLDTIQELEAEKEYRKSSSQRPKTPRKH